ncbi:YbaY family lipoprotein [Ferrimonas senticii]|uniref:YbaY family lipoprotein n=1 Tax=Ferrimonas senticii TaxID=394566 RepID=UPI00146D2577|nr:YbaY family lipoprotein [Ferrimonas senticii]
MKKVMALAAVMLMAGCSGDSEPQMEKDQSLAGELQYRERILTPPGSQLKVAVSDANGTILGMVQQEVQGGPPFNYQLDYAKGNEVMVHATLTFAGDDKPRFEASVTLDQAGQILLRGAQ